MTATDWTPERRAELRSKFIDAGGGDFYLRTYVALPLDVVPIVRACCPLLEALEAAEKSSEFWAKGCAKFSTERDELRERLEKVASNLESLRHEYEPNWRVAIHELAALARDNRAPNAGEEA